MKLSPKAIKHLQTRKNKSIAVQKYWDARKKEAHQGKSKQQCR